jgi:transketolase
MAVVVRKKPTNDTSMLNHSVKLNPRIGEADIEQVPTRNGYGEGVVELGQTDQNVVVLTGDLAGSTKAADFQKKFSDRFIEVGIAEQNMMGIAAGLAIAGKTPFISSYAVFSPGRSWDQLRVSVCYSNLNVKIAGAHTGISVGPDGATHQALEDIAITRVLPNLTVVVPCDYVETKKATIALGQMQGPAYFRFAREKTPVMTTAETPFRVGKAEIFKEGSQVALIGSGPVLYNGLMAAMELEKEGISVLVINNHTIKPIDSETIVWAAKLTGAVVTLEEHQIMGGCGSAVAEVLAQNYPVPMEMVGVSDHFGESGEPNELIEKYGMGKDNIKQAIKKVLARKNHD